MQRMQPGDQRLTASAIANRLKGLDVAEAVI